MGLKQVSFVERVSYLRGSLKSIVQRATINKYRVRAVDTGVDKFPDGDCKFGMGRQEMRVEALIV